jgi:hypothetical protein
MKQIIKDFLFEMIRQIFGWSKPRAGEIITTPYTRQKMREYGLDIATLEDAFDMGQEKNVKLCRDILTQLSVFISKL